MELRDYYRKKRRAAAARRLILAGIILFSFAAAFWGFFWLPFLRIRQIEVTNYPDKTTIESEILSYLDARNLFFLPEDNFFIASSAGAALLLRNKGFGLAEVTKKFPGTLAVDFHETKPWLIFCGPDTCFYVDQNGVFADSAPKFSENPLPAFQASTTATLGNKILPDDKIRFLRVWTLGLADLNFKPDKILWNMDAGDLKIFMKEGWFLYLNSNTQSDKIFPDFKLLIKERIQDKISRLEYIDMRFPDKAFYKLKSVN